MFKMLNEKTSMELTGWEAVKMVAFVIIGSYQLCKWLAMIMTYAAMWVIVKVDERRKDKEADEEEEVFAD